MTKQPINLTNMERRYFELLMQETEPLDRSYFEQLHEEYLSSNAVDVHMKNLRKKLAGMFEIEGIRGVGYVMRKV